MDVLSIFIWITLALLLILLYTTKRLWDYKKEDFSNKIKIAELEELLRKLKRTV